MPVPPSRATALALLVSCLDACTVPVRVVIQSLDGAEELAQLCIPPLNSPGCSQETRERTLLPSDPPPPLVPVRRKRHPLRALLLEILSERHPQRVTGPEIIEAVRLAGQEWSDKTIQRILDALRIDGVIDNDRDEGGQGYGFR